MNRLVLVIPALLSAACATVHQEQHSGVHFSADIGAVASRSQGSQGGTTEKISGTGTSYAVAVGGAVAPNLILGGQLWGNAVVAPEVHVSGESDTFNDFTYSVIGLGPMIKYYFMPVNLYVAATPSLARLTITDFRLDETRSRWGPALRCAVGKEWHVGERWGLGVAGVLDLASNEARGNDHGQDVTYQTVAGAVVFSASFD